jgi:hypothetical protein
MKTKVLVILAHRKYLRVIRRLFECVDCLPRSSPGSLASKRITLKVIQLTRKASVLQARLRGIRNKYPNALIISYTRNPEALKKKLKSFKIHSVRERDGLKALYKKVKALSR